MAIYYVRNDGSNVNAGTGPLANQAWQTVTYALANMVLTNGTNYLYIAPGVYRETPTVTITPSSTQTLIIQGDPSASQFTGLSSGVVRITSFTTDTANPSAVNILTISGKSYITISRIHFDVFGQTGTRTNAIYGLTNPDNIVVEYCTFQGHNTGVYFSVGFYAINSGAVQSIRTNRCIFNNLYIGSWFESSSGAGSSQNVTVTDSLYVGCDLSSIYFYGNGLNRTVYNCTIVNFIQHGIRSDTGQSGGTTVQNCLIGGSNGNGVSTTSVGITENYNRFVSCVARANVSPSGANSTSGGIFGMDIGYGLLNSIINQQMFSTLLNSPNLNFGLSSGAPATDLYGVTWTGTSPDAGSATYRNLSAVGSYLPTERNASTITIAPASTSQSIELYLGATDLAFSTSGLAAYYVRNQAAPVAITLVTQTATGAWTSGGFAEISSSLVPGVYRLDVPNAAFAAGASDVTIVVRGASGTNGAVLTVNLIAAPTDAVLVRMGPFEVKADGLGASDPLDIQKGAQHGIDIQCVDNNGAGIDITSATVTAKVYNSGATLVDTYSCTATYAADGRATFTIDTTVTNVPGTYTATITRTTGASDTQVFGPLRIYVRDI